jgi:RimJ/RimL family protein N-acetyltransferase
VLRRRVAPVDPHPVLTDGVVVLRALTHEDVALVQPLEDDEMARRFGFNGPSTPDQLHAAVDRWEAGWAAGRATANFVVCRVADGAPVGGVELRQQGDAVGQLSWWTFAPYRRQGCAGRAVRLLCRWAFTELGLVRLEALVEPDNAASRATAQQAGLLTEGVLRSKQTIGHRRADLVLLARLAGDPEPPGERDVPYAAQPTGLPDHPTAPRVAAPPAPVRAPVAHVRDAAPGAPPPAFVYDPSLDGDADPGEVVWAWVPFEEDPTMGKDRPVVVLGREGGDLLVVQLSTKVHSQRQDRAEWIELGRGPWDDAGRVSYVDLDRLLRVPQRAVRREGAILDRRRFDEVADAVRHRHGLTL